MATMHPGGSAPPPMPQPGWAPTGPSYAGLLPRFLAYLIDLVVMGAIGLVARALILQARSDTTAWFATLAIILVVHGGYLIGFWSRRGQTPGMSVLKLHLQRADGGPLDGRVAGGRFLLFALAIVLPLLSWVIWIAMAVTVATDPRHQGLHDRLAGTVMVRQPVSPAL